jgi:hypothetical protein
VFVFLLLNKRERTLARERSTKKKKGKTQNRSIDLFYQFQHFSIGFHRLLHIFFLLFQHAPATSDVSMVQTRSKGTVKGSTKSLSSSNSDASSSSSSSPSSSSLTNALAIATGAAGVYASYLTQGVLQERLATTLYAGGKRFDGLDALHGAQAAACAVFALLLLGVAPGLRPKKGKKKSAASTVAPPSSYWRAGLSNSVGPTLGYLALKNISYPAQVSEGEREKRLNWKNVSAKKRNLFFFFFFRKTKTRPQPLPLPPFFPLPLPNSTIRSSPSPAR